MCLYPHVHSTQRTACGPTRRVPARVSSRGRGVFSLHLLADCSWCLELQLAFVIGSYQQRGRPALLHAACSQSGTSLPPCLTARPASARVDTSASFGSEAQLGYLLLLSLVLEEVLSTSAGFAHRFLSWVDVEYCQRLFSMMFEMIMWFFLLKFVNTLVKCSTDFQILNFINLYWFSRFNIRSLANKNNPLTCDVVSFLHTQFNLLKIVLRIFASQIRIKVCGATQRKQSHYFVITLNESSL